MKSNSTSDLLFLLLFFESSIIGFLVEIRSEPMGISHGLSVVVVVVVYHTCIIEAFG